MADGLDDTTLIDTKDLIGSKVWIEKPKKKDPDATKKMGRVRACVFHPSERRCVGFIVKRPDIAWMIRRDDLFVAYNGYDVVDGAIMLHDDSAATDKGACKALGIDLDECVLWVGLPVMCRDGTDFGLVGSVLYDAKTGEVDTLVVSQGATANALLGKRKVPADMILGFRRGIGAELFVPNDPDAEGDDAVHGAILVDDAVKGTTVRGGFAEKAGEATAIMGYRAHQAVESAKPAVSDAAAAAGKAINKGAYLTGRQIQRASGMFAEFKSEYDKASGKLDAEEAPAAEKEPAGGGAVAATRVDGAGRTAGAGEAGRTAGADGAGRVGGAAGAGGAGKAGASATAAQEDEAQEDEETDDIWETTAQAVGAHLSKARGMFSAFKEEYDKARHG